MVALLSCTGICTSESQMDHFCGGTVVASRYVVTAAHCVQGREAANVFVR